jgi:two-component system, NtrC family, response regulator HydG
MTTMTTKQRIRVLIIDDEESIRDACHQILTRRGYQVDTAGTAREGLALAQKDVYDVILLDIRMPEMDGMQLLRTLKEREVSGRVIIITGFGTIQLAVEVMRYGACNVLTKPFSADELSDAVHTALDSEGVPAPEKDIPLLVGESEYMKDLRETIRRIAPTDSIVLITGESGTGKELVARAIRDFSRRRRKPFVTVDCSALVENLMESELFGHVKGAFSGAGASREGRFQMAHGGTLFLDEISNITLTVQAKLLRAIQEQEVPRVGSSRPEKVDVRIIAATNRDIREEVEQGKFREDLYYRLSVIPLHIKPLREHGEDILPLAHHYLGFYRDKYRSIARSFSEEAAASLLSCRWPGNVRELKNTMERLCVLCEHETVTLSDLLYLGQSMVTRVPMVDSHSGIMTLVDVEKNHIEKALFHFHFQMGKTARFLGIDRKTLRMKIRAYGIKTEEPS